MSLCVVGSYGNYCIQCIYDNEIGESYCQDMIAWFDFHGLFSFLINTLEHSIFSIFSYNILHFISASWCPSRNDDVIPTFAERNVFYLTMLQLAEVRAMKTPSCFSVDKEYSQNVSKTVFDDILAFQPHHLMNQYQSSIFLHHSHHQKHVEPANLVFWGHKMIFLNNPQSSIYITNSTKLHNWISWLLNKLHQPRQSLYLSRLLWMDSWMPKLQLYKHVAGHYKLTKDEPQSTYINNYEYVNNDIVWIACW